MYEVTAGTGLLVHVAALLQLLGLLNRNQLFLRGFILLGSLAYVAYYYAHPEQPLWGAIFWSSVLAVANIIGIGRVLLERTRFRGTGDERYFLRMLKLLTPGQMRRLMRLAEWRVAEHTTAIVQEDQPVASLYFVLDGQIEIVKAGRSFSIEPSVFIGEIAFLLNTKASASVFLQPGTKYIEWPAEALRKAIAHNPSLGEAMDKLFNNELARKVANSWQLEPSHSETQVVCSLDQGQERRPPT